MYELGFLCILADTTFSARDLHWHDTRIFVKQILKIVPRIVPSAHVSIYIMHFYASIVYIGEVSVSTTPDVFS